MTYGELTRKLKRLGFELKRQGRGSHEFWWNPKTGQVTVIAAHKAKEIPKGTLSDILKQLGISIDQLRNI